jgi:hypothetical protein
MKTTLHFIALLCLAFTANAQQIASGTQLKLTATFTSASGTAYTSGDSVGTVQTLTNAASLAGRIVTLDSIKIKDSANQKKAGRILIFDGSAPTLTDNAAFAFGSSLTHLIGTVEILAADYVTVDSKGIAERPWVNIRLPLAIDSKNLYVAFQTTDAPTYGNGGTLTVEFHFNH